MSTPTTLQSLDLSPVKGDLAADKLAGFCCSCKQHLTLVIFTIRWPLHHLLHPGCYHPNLPAGRGTQELYTSVFPAIWSSCPWLRTNQGLLPSSWARPAYPAHVPCLWVNNPTLSLFCGGMIGRADIEGSKSNVTINNKWKRIRETFSSEWERRNSKDVSLTQNKFKLLLKQIFCRRLKLGKGIVRARVIYITMCWDSSLNPKICNSPFFCFTSGLQNYRLWW